MRISDWSSDVCSSDLGLSGDRLLDRWRVDSLFRRCADADAGFLDRAGGARRLWHGRGAHRDDLRPWRFHARTGVHLYVPLAAYPDRDDGRKIAAGDL